MLELEQLNAADQDEFERLLDGVYEHSPWVARAAWAQRPFRTLVQLKQALVQSVTDADSACQLALICAHPDLAGKAMLKNALSTESTLEQTRAGLVDADADNLARLQSLNASYRDRFGFPFVLAVRGPRGNGLAPKDILATFERRLRHPAGFERAEALRHVHRIAEIRLNERVGFAPVSGNQVWDWAEELAEISEPPFRERGELTVTYLTEAHQACAARILQWMRDDCGFDTAWIDPVGNVVGVYHGQVEASPRLMTGSHYDTVRNGGRYDGRLGILAPMVAVRDLHRAKRRLPFGLEVVAFAEEEGQRYKAVFLGSGALTGQFDPAWLDQRDAQGVSMREAMVAAGRLPDAIASVRRNPSDYLGFVEIHIEQGPVLNAANRPLGIVTSINGNRRFVGDIRGTASHAGTTPMDQRRDALVAAAEWVQAVESLAAQTPGGVATVGQFEVVAGSTNVVPGHCRFSLDVRAPEDAARDALVGKITDALHSVADRRGLTSSLEQTMVAAAAPTDPQWQARWERAVSALGLALFHLPSGAGHDAMKLHEIMPQAMLFVRGEHAGISHNPLESITCDDADLAVQAFGNLLGQLATDMR